MIGLKGHAVVFVEIAPGTGRFDRQGLQVSIAQPRGRIVLHLGEQPLDPSGRAAVCVHRAASFARSIARQKGVAGRREELDVFDPWLSRRTVRPAEDARGFHGDEEDAVIRGVAVHHRTLHFDLRRQGVHALQPIRALPVDLPISERGSEMELWRTRRCDSACPHIGAWAWHPSNHVGWSTRKNPSLRPETHPAPRPALPGPTPA